MAPLLLIAALLCFLNNLSPTDALMTSTTIHFARNSFMHKSKVPSIASRLMSASSSNNNVPSYPRAAVSVVIRFHDASPSSSTTTTPTTEPVRYLLIQRGKAPNKGLWSSRAEKLKAMNEQWMPQNVN